MASLVLVGGASGEPPSAFTPPSGRKLTAIDLVGGIYCHICTSVFGHKKQFDSHYLAHSTGTELITYTCVVCHANSTSYQSFRGHCYTAHVIKDRFKCDNCNKNFSKLSTLKEHIDAVHNFRCKEPNCDKRFPTKKELHVHQILHKEDPKPPYQCQNCMEEIENIESCEEHIDRHCVFTYPCPVCSEDITKESATQHLTKHFGFEVLNEDIEVTEDEEIPDDSSINIVGGVFCCHCNTLFKNRIEIDQHFAEEHPDEPILYSCVICGKKYERYPQFGNHCYFHYSKNRFACESCHKTFPRLSLLVSHTNEHAGTHHVERREAEAVGTARAGAGAGAECRVCGLRLGGGAAARRHLAAHRRAQFACPVCARRYAEKYLLLKHVPQHFERVLHMCRVCHKAFAARSRLVQHAKTHSPAARLYACTLCTKAFLKPYQLAQHLNVHSGARPYACPRCPKAFASRPNWHKHMQRMHGTDAGAGGAPPVPDHRTKPHAPNARSELQHNNETMSDILEAEDAKAFELEKSCELGAGDPNDAGDMLMLEPMEPMIDATVVESEARRYEAASDRDRDADPLGELALYLPEDIDTIITEMLNSPAAAALPPREYGPDWAPEEGPLAHVAPQLVGPPALLPPPPAPTPAPLPHWEPPIISKLCSGLYDYDLSDMSLSIIDNIF